MFNTRRMWLPALLGALFMSRPRNGRGWMGSAGRGSRNRSWVTRGTSRNWLARLFGSRNSAFRLLP
jgi:hypothetical protein